MNENRIYQNRDDLKKYVDEKREAGASIVFTNGVFDLIHPGHVETLRRARIEGDLLVVAINDDASVKRLKGEGRPILPLQQRLRILAAIEYVDAVTSFHEDTPIPLLELIKPEVLVKGGDYDREGIVGHDLVESWGGRAVPAGFTPGWSTSEIIRIIKDRFPA